MHWFCHDVGTGYLIDPAEPAEGDKVEILETWERFTFLPKSFFGLVNDDGQTFQFRRELDGRMLFDIPDESMGGSWQSFGTLEEARDSMLQFLDSGQLPDREGMVFQSWH